MKLALQLALVTGALVAGGALHAAARAWATAPGLAAGVAVAGVVLGVALTALLLSSRAEDRDHLVSLLNAVAGVGLGLAVDRRHGPGLAPGLIQGGLILLVAGYLCARIGLRRTDHASRSTPELLRAAARSDRARLAADELLPGRGDALDVAFALGSDDPDPAVRATATRFVARLVQGAPADARARAVKLTTSALEQGGDVQAAGIALASRLAEPDLIGPLRRLAGARDPVVVLEARARCGDLDVIDDLLAATDTDRARDVVRALGSAAQPALAERLARASDDDAARLLALVGALPRSDDAYDLAAARAGADRPPAVRAAALRALADLDPGRAAPLARAAADADDLLVRTWASAVLRAAGQG